MDEKTDDSFDDELDFLDEDEFQDDDNNEPSAGNTAAVSTTQKSSTSSSTKWIIILGIIFAFGFIIFNKFINQPSVEPVNKPIQQEIMQPVIAKEQVSDEKISEDDKMLTEALNNVNQEKTQEEITNLTDTGDNSIQTAKQIITKPLKQLVEEKETLDEKNAKQIEELKQTISSISQEITDNVNTIKQLEKRLVDITSHLDKINQNTSAMDSRILGIIESVDSLTQDLGNVRRIIREEDLDLTLSAQKSATEKPITYQAPMYVIHAIIPGRAWLKSSTGQIITVAEGDTLGDYGTVAVIDASNNIVRTSSGVSFR